MGKAWKKRQWPPCPETPEDSFPATDSHGSTQLLPEADWLEKYCGIRCERQFSTAEAFFAKER